MRETRQGVMRHAETHCLCKPFDDIRKVIRITFLDFLFVLMMSTKKNTKRLLSGTRNLIVISILIGVLITKIMLKNIQNEGWVDGASWEEER